MPQRPTIYLDNASTSFPKAPGVAEAVARAISKQSASPGRGATSSQADAAAIIEQLRMGVASLIGARDPERIVLFAGATDAINTAILGTLAPILPVRTHGHPAERPKVVASALEHNAAARPLARLARAGLIELEIVPPGPDAIIDPDRFADRIDERTRLAVLTCASNAFGSIQPVAEVGRAIRGRGLPALLLADAAQSAGLVPIHAEADAIDLCAFGSHKALRGTPGVGVLYVGPRAFDGSGDPDRQPLQPVILGGTGGAACGDEPPPGLPLRFEPGTRNLPAMAGLLEALYTVNADTMAGVLDHERALIARARDRLSSHAGVRVFGAADLSRSVGVLSIAADAWDPSDLANALDASFGVLTRAGFHCAAWAHQAMGSAATGGTLRLSTGPETTPQEIDACCEAIAQILRS